MAGCARKAFKSAERRPTLTGEVTLEGWIFMVGLRVFDIGALIVWLVWFFKLRDSDDDDGDDHRGDGGSKPEPKPDRGPGGLPAPLPDAGPWPSRRRDHEGDRSAPPVPQRRRGLPVPTPARAPVKRTGR
jgi:hypothetical protein